MLCATLDSKERGYHTAAQDLIDRNSVRPIALHPEVGPGRTRVQRVAGHAPAATAGLAKAHAANRASQQRFAPGTVWGGDNLLLRAEESQELSPESLQLLVKKPKKLLSI